MGQEVRKQAEALKKASKDKEVGVPVRSTVSKVVQEVFNEEYIRKLAEDCKTLTKGFWADGECPECGSRKKVKVEVPDIYSQIKILTELLEQAEGRPGTAEGEPGGVEIIIERMWPDGGRKNRKHVPATSNAVGVSPK